MNRRELLQSAAALIAAGLPAPALLLSHRAQAEPLKSLGAAQSFDFAALKGRARAMAAVAYQAPPANLPRPIADLDWDRWQSIRFKDEHALWREQNLPFQARFFHLGFTVRTPVRLFEVVSGQAREIAYDSAMFDYGRSGVRRGALPDNLGFAGFRLNFQDDWVRDVAAFQGASYFRAVGGEKQYGLSARGLAINCGMATPEEFPNFIAWYLQRPDKGASTVLVYGLLDSPSAAGAYRFTITPGETLAMEVDAAIYPRRVIDRIGIAPLTSMFLTAENDRRVDRDWRPEIHDSDGLQMWSGSGEWIWRPLNNPRELRVNAFADQDPRGFGLMQRDRSFDHYQDDGVYYDRRPSLWVEPKSAWGAGSILLVEIPTPDETHDNIVAFWSPAEAVQVGKEYLFAYKLHWGARAPVQPPLATTLATRTGIGGMIGRPRSYFSWRFAVDFAGEALAQIPSNARVEAVIGVSRGRVEIVSARPLEALHGWRAMFDLVPDARTEPIDLRLFLRLGGKPLTETWLYQYTPPPPAERRL